MLYACILAAAGLFGDTVLLQAFVRPEALWHPRMASAAPPVHGTGILLMTLIWLAVGPFWLAGIYTTIGEALHDRPVGWKTFWVWGARNYGRWGLIGYMALYGAALMIMDMVGGLATFLLGVRDPVVGIGIAVALLIVVLLIGLPWMLRMLGGLFVDRLSWSASWTRSFARKNYGIILGVLLHRRRGHGRCHAAEPPARGLRDRRNNPLPARRYGREHRADHLDDGAVHCHGLHRSAQ